MSLQLKTKKIRPPEVYPKGMNILHLSTHIPWRGGEQQLAYLLDELDKLEDIQQSVVCALGSGLEAYCKKNDINHLAIKKRSAFDLVFAKQLRQLCKRLEPDLIHIHDSHAHTFAIIAATLYKNKIPLVLSRKVDFPIKNSRFSRFKYNHPLIKKIICVSGAIKEIMKAGIDDHEVLQVVHDGVDTLRFAGGHKGYLRKKYGVGEDELLIGNVAAIAPHKDYFTFVDTVEVLVSQGVKAVFFIIGDGPENEAIRNYVSIKKLEANIIMTGFVDDIEGILPELDVLLYTSKTEGLGSTILDAYGAGVNVVATEAGGIPEIVEHMSTGLLAPIRNPEKLAENVKLLLTDPILSEKLREGGRIKLKEFGKGRLAAKTFNVYKEVLELY